MKSFRIAITGTQPLLLHNSRLSNPLDPYARRMAEIHGKRKKTTEDYEELARREWLGSLYYEPDAGIYLPDGNIERALLDSARMSRQGKTIERGVFITTPRNTIMNVAPDALVKMADDENMRMLASVKVGMQRVMRCRPMLRTWAVEADGVVDETLLDPIELQRIAARAGRLVGLGDWRPRYGRFTAAVTITGDAE